MAEEETGTDRNYLASESSHPSPARVGGTQKGGQGRSRGGVGLEWQPSLNLDLGNRSPAVGRANEGGVG